MRLKHLRIANCSRISDIDIDVRDNMVLIGPNGSGKSTVLLCLDMLLGMSEQQLSDALSEEFIRDKSRPMTVEAVLKDICDDTQQVTVRIDVHPNGKTIKIERSLLSCDTRKSSPEEQKSTFNQTPSEDWKSAIDSQRNLLDSWTLLRTQANADGVHQDLSDGMRALSTMTAYNQLHKTANILAIDEPEAHLHPSSQRSLAKMLKASGGQMILVTHSPTIAGSFEPDEIVVIRADGTAVQPREHFLSKNAGMLARWWIGRQLEPLTAGAVIAVEGPSDRVIVDRVASVTGFDLDRHDIVLVETNGCGDMKVVESIFGSGGFGIPLFELIDDDARDDAARRFDIDPCNLETRNIFVSVSDLEDEYVRAIGAKKLWDGLMTAKTFSKRVFALCKVEPDGYPTERNLAQFIREKSNRKIPAALIAAELIDADNALSVESVARLLAAASS